MQKMNIWSNTDGDFIVSGVEDINKLDMNKLVNNNWIEISIKKPKPAVRVNGGRGLFTKRALAYRAYKDELYKKCLKVINIDDLRDILLGSFQVVFVIPMPKGNSGDWSEEKRKKLNLTPHKNKKGPDGDNLVKALLDTLFPKSDEIFNNDAGVWDEHIIKVWGREGSIRIRAIKPFDARAEFKDLL